MNMPALSVKEQPRVRMKPCVHNCNPCPECKQHLQPSFQKLCRDSKVLQEAQGAGTAQGAGQEPREVRSPTWKRPILSTLAPVVALPSLSPAASTDNRTPTQQSATHQLNSKHLSTSNSTITSKEASGLIETY